MRRAIELGRGVEGTTGDNPNVGCVIVASGVIVAEGATQPPGHPHAEATALLAAQAAGIPVQGATLYTTVEPCSFEGRTPACAPAIVRAGIARVVLGVRDPHPRVNGRGVAILRAAGVAVVEGVDRDEVTDYLRAWLLRDHSDGG